MYDFSRKIFRMFYFINCSSFNVWLPLLLEFVVITCCQICDVMNFEINLSFLIKPLFYITKKSGQKCKALFIIFKGPSLTQIKTIFLECESSTLKALIKTKNIRVLLPPNKNVALKADLVYLS